MSNHQKRRQIEACLEHQGWVRSNKDDGIYYKDGRNPVKVLKMLLMTYADIQDFFTKDRDRDKEEKREREPEPPGDFDDETPAPLTQEEQTDAFARDLDRLVDRYAQEFQITHASIIGCLHLMIARIERVAMEEEDGD